MLSASSAFSSSSNEHFYLSGSLGPSIAIVGAAGPQIIYLGGLVADSYPVNSMHASATTISLSGGYEFVGINLKPAISIGMGVYRNLSAYGYKGQVIESVGNGLGVPLYNYRYNINSTRLMAEMQFTWILGQFSPFVNMGAGTAWNQATSYSETLTSNAVTSIPGFKSSTTANFAFQLGLGLSYLFNFSKAKSDFQTERLSIGYRFTDVGDVMFGTRGATYPFNLDTGRLKISDIYLSYTHLF
jgi:hypothetical protein